MRSHKVYLIIRWGMRERERKKERRKTDRERERQRKIEMKGERKSYGWRDIKREKDRARKKG